MANSERGGVIVVGVEDSVGGIGAFVGACLDVEWLRRRWALTQPHLAVDEIEEVDQDGARLYLINVPAAIEEVRVDGRLQARFGTECVELDGNRAREFLEGRRSYDWSAKPSGWTLSGADANALQLVRELYRSARGAAPQSDIELVRRVGLIVGDADIADPPLSNAGALLLCRYEPGVEQVVLLATASEGVASRSSVRGPAPLLPLVANALAFLGSDDAFASYEAIVGLQRQVVRAVPEVAYREALVNAVMHRDYELTNSAITIHVIGSPPYLLKIPT